MSGEVHAITVDRMTAAKLLSMSLRMLDELVKRTPEPRQARIRCLSMAGRLDQRVVVHIEQIALSGDELEHAVRVGGGLVDALVV